MEKFDGLMMSQQFAFLDYFITREGPSNPEAEVVELYEIFKLLSSEEQDKLEEEVRAWAASLTREEMFVGAKEEKRRRTEKNNK